MLARARAILESIVDGNYQHVKVSCQCRYGAVGAANPLDESRTKVLFRFIGEDH